MIAPIRSVLMNGGQGDVVMATVGLIALQAAAPQAFAPDLHVYTRTLVQPLIATLLPDATVGSLEAAKSAASPRYYTSAKTSWSTTARNWFGADWYVNFAERRRWASTGHPGPSAALRLQQNLTDQHLLGSANPSGAPTYYGTKMWEPLARAHGIGMIEFARHLGLTWALVRERMHTFAHDVDAERFARGVLVLPVGQSFQTAPPEFVARLQTALPSVALTCAFAPGEKVRTSYEAAGLPCTTTDSVAELVAAICVSPVVLTVDSFASHIAQFAARRHVALMSHDLPQHTLHPFAPGRTVFTPLKCSPCVYLGREAAGECAMGQRACLAFGSSDYLADATRAVQSALAI